MSLTNCDAQLLDLELRSQYQLVFNFEKELEFSMREVKTFASLSLGSKLSCKPTRICIPTQWESNPSLQYSLLFLPTWILI